MIYIIFFVYVLQDDNEILTASGDQYVSEEAYRLALLSLSKPTESILEFWWKFDVIALGQDMECWKEEMHWDPGRAHRKC